MGVARGLGLTYLARRCGELLHVSVKWSASTSEEVGLPALLGLGLNVLHLLLELLSARPLGRLVHTVEGAARQVVLHHALRFANGPLPVVPGMGVHMGR